MPGVRDALVGLWEVVQAALVWLQGRWSLGSEPEPWMFWAALGLVVACLVLRPVWVMARNVTTVVHEMGHVVVAAICGRTISGIKVHTDTSGLAITRGSPRGLGVLLVSLAGYPAPAALGLVLTWLAMDGRAGVGLLALVLLLAAAFLLVRNLWGALVVLVCLLSAWAVLWYAEGVVASAVVLVVGVFLATSSLRAAGDLARLHAREEVPVSDATLARSNSLISPVFWVGVFLVLTALGAGLSLYWASAALGR